MTGFVLKLIALATMIVDHTGAVLFPGAAWMRVVGRIAFPIYIFLIAEGCEHTRSLWKYALRLFVFALVSEAPFDFALYMRNGLSWSAALAHQNVFFTLALAVFAVALTRELHKLKAPFYLAALIVIPCAALAHAGNTDYGWLGVAAIFACALMPNKWRRLAMVAAFVAARYFGSWIFLLGASVALPVIALYNGERGPRLRMAFYAAYPAHLAALAVIRHMLLPM